MLLASTKYFLEFTEKEQKESILYKQSLLDSLHQTKKNLVSKSQDKEKANSAFHQKTEMIEDQYENLLSQYDVKFYDENQKLIPREKIDWIAIKENLWEKPIATLNFQETQELFYLYFGPGIVSQKYIQLAKGKPALLQRMILLSSVEKQGQF
ncbi:MAG: hypothetical protein GXP45_04345 [bacterium]|nr:hypothetical protein [bacterium]